jgi:hypothetical protein
MTRWRTPRFPYYTLLALSRRIEELTSALDIENTEI